jgi:hypothetical protein
MTQLALIHHHGDDYPYWDDTKYLDGEIIDSDESHATLEDLVKYCDHDAESCNAHDFCGAHRLLGRVLYDHVGRAKATEIMLAIAKMEGLQGMTGVEKDFDHYQTLNVGIAGHDWDENYDD